MKVYSPYLMIMCMWDKKQVLKGKTIVLPFSMILSEEELNGKYRKNNK